jgi:uracil phosphoribosyltransferase
MQEEYYLDRNCREVPHRYGHNNLHILADPGLFTLLAQACSKDTDPPSLRCLVRQLYASFMMEVMSREFPTADGEVTTHMHGALQAIGMPERAVIQSNALFDGAVSGVSVGIARAGTIPSEVCFDTMERCLGWKRVRQDSMSGERRLSTDGRGVDGTDIVGIKTGSVEDAIVVFPDPMCATGGSVVQGVEAYLEKAQGTPLKVIVMPLIITPEAARELTKKMPEVTVYALRLDRGMSSAEALQRVPGSDPEESGLTEEDYIVPGGGGFGERLTNSEA